MAGSQWWVLSSSVACVDLGRLKTRQAVAFRTSCTELMAQADKRLQGLVQVVV
uniref:Uncharacterized protein n=1 Tax=Anguilla anguilla TaxID=7936 RepID=A0A0E9SM43_ANGAN